MSNRKRVSLGIEGMHCSSCAVYLQKTLLAIWGVEDVNVNYASEKAWIVYDPDRTGIESFDQAIMEAWYFPNHTSSDVLQDWSWVVKNAQDRHSYNHFKRSIVWLVLSVPLLVFMVYDLYLGLPFSQKLMPYMAPVSFLCSTLVLFVLGREFFQWAWSALRVGTFNMYSLISIGTLTAYGFSVYTYWKFIFETGSYLWLHGMKVPGLFFETAAFLLVFVSFGKYLEAWAKRRVSDAVSGLIWLVPESASVMRGGDFIELPISELKIWDVVTVHPGERVPVDGTIISGLTSIDESMLTGESVPVIKKIGDSVYTGTINGHWSIQIEVASLWEDTALSKIARLIEDAQGSRAPIQEIADRISAVFVPVVIGIATITFLIWYSILWVGIQESLMFFSAVIVIACPCALWLATPTAVMAGISRAASLGILIKWGEPLQIASEANTIVLDKTGTLTEWSPRVVEIGIFWNRIDEKKMISVISGLEMGSEHPLALAILQYGREQWQSPAQVRDFQAIPGRWVSGEIDGILYHFWNRGILGEASLEDSEISLIDRLETNWSTVMILSDSESVLGYVAVSDAIRETAASTIETLLSLGIEIIMLTWDNRKTAEIVASRLWIRQFFAEVLPQGKLEVISQLKSSGRKVMMVGDWINDAPALALADIGVAMGRGVDVAVEAGNIVLMKNDLSDLIRIIQISRTTTSKIYQNLGFSLVYNLLWIPLAAWVFWVFWYTLQPEFAWLAMAASSICVVGNSLLLRNYRFRKSFFDFIPFLVAVVFAAIIWEASSFGGVLQGLNQTPLSSVENVSAIATRLSHVNGKIGYDSLGVPKIMVNLGNQAEANEFLSLLDFMQGTSDFSWGGVVLGYAEASMMIREGLIDWVWSILPDFFWSGSIRVSGILRPTWTIVDDAHFMTNETYSAIQLPQDVFFRKGPDWTVKTFLFVRSVSDIPSDLKNQIDPIVENIRRNGADYVPVYLGHTEASMMLREWLIAGEWSLLSDFFGNPVVFDWIMKRTYTALDMMHLVPDSFRY